MKFPVDIIYISIFWGVGFGVSFLFNGDASNAPMLTLAAFMGWAVRRILRFEAVKPEEIPAGIKCGFDTSDLAAARCERERCA